MTRHDPEVPERTHRSDRHAEDRLDAVIEEAVGLEFETGVHEETVEEAKRHLLVRLALVAAGSVVTLFGIALLALPGPGLVVVAIGLGLLATEVPFAARLLERVRERLPADADGRIPRPMVAMMAVTCVTATGASLWWALR